MMPHMLVSHSPRDCFVIYPAQPGDRARDMGVATRDAEHAVRCADRAGAMHRDAELGGKGDDRRHALGAQVTAGKAWGTPNSTSYGVRRTAYDVMPTPTPKACPAFRPPL